MTILSKPQQTAIREVLGPALWARLQKQGIPEEAFRDALEALDAAGPTGPDESRKRYFIQVASTRAKAYQERARANGLQPGGKTGRGAVAHEQEIRANLRERKTGSLDWLMGDKP